MYKIDKDKKLIFLKTIYPSRALKSKYKKMNKNIVYTPLDSYEKKLESFLDKKDFKSSSKLKSTKNMLQEASKRYVFLQKSKSVTLRLNREDIIRVKAKAKRNNMPYQTLIGTLIHKYVRGETSLSI